MGGRGVVHRRGGYAPSGQGKCFYDLQINRSLVYPHPEIDSFIGQVAARLGERFEPAKEVRGVTILESRALLAAIKTKRQHIDRNILAEAEADLKNEMQLNNLGRGPIEVDVDSNKPLGLFGRHRDVLALRLRHDLRLGADRGAVETYIDVTAGHVGRGELETRAKPLEPHIKIGTVKTHLLSVEQRTAMAADPIGFVNQPMDDASDWERLVQLREGPIYAPDHVALNGIKIAVEARD